MQEREHGSDRAASRDGNGAGTGTGYVQTNGIETYYERRGRAATR